MATVQTLGPPNGNLFIFGLFVLLLCEELKRRAVYGSTQTVLIFLTRYQGCYWAFTYARSKFSCTLYCTKITAFSYGKWRCRVFRLLAFSPWLCSAWWWCWIRFIDSKYWPYSYITYITIAFSANDTLASTVTLSFLFCSPSQIACAKWSAARSEIHALVDQSALSAKYVENRSIPITVWSIGAFLPLTC